MTLVVANKQGNNLVLVADTKLNDPSIIENNPLCSVLKIAILHPIVQLGYAGVIHYAEKAIKEFYDRNISDLESLVDLLSGIHTESNFQTDFILCTAVGGIPKIYVIKEGKTSRDVSSAWIGDQQAFNLYQRTFHSFDTGDLKSKMRSALKNVIDAQTIDSVGWFVDCSDLYYPADSHPIFLYDMVTESCGGEDVTIPANAVMDLPYGDAKSGAFSISTMYSQSLVLPALGRYFEQIQLGLMYCPKLSFEAYIYRNVDGHEFVRKVFEDHAVPLAGVILHSGTYFEFIDALSLAEESS